MDATRRDILMIGLMLSVTSGLLGRFAGVVTAFVRGRFDVDLVATAEGAGGTMHFILSRSSAEPSAAAVKAGQEADASPAAGAASVAVPAAGTITAVLAGVPGGVLLTAFAVQERAGGGFGPVTRSTPFYPNLGAVWSDGLPWKDVAFL